MDEKGAFFCTVCTGSTITTTKAKNKLSSPSFSIYAVVGASFRNAALVLLQSPLQSHFHGRTQGESHGCKDQMVRTLGLFIRYR